MASQFEEWQYNQKKKKIIIKRNKPGMSDEREASSVAFFLHSYEGRKCV
ncbi:unnamed protein product, partial [Arabidopsis halleri]